MKTFIKNIDYITTFKYTFLFFNFLTFAKLESDILPYSASIFVSALTCGASIIPTSLLYVFSFLCLNAVGLLGSQAVFCAIMSCIVFIYRKTKTKTGVGFAVYTLICMLAFIFMGDSAIFYTYERRIFTALITSALTFFCIIATNALSVKGLKFKLCFEEFVSIAVVFSLCGTGACNLISPYFWRVVCALTILLVSYVYRIGVSTVISCVLGISFALYYNDVNYVSVFLILSIVAESLLPLSRYLSAIGLIMADYLIQLIFGVYSAYELVEFLSLLAGALIFCIIPEKPLRNLKDKLYSFREKQLVRQAINRNRQKISGRLFEISSVFSEMASAFECFKKNALTEDNAKEIMGKQLLNLACNECEHKIRCKKYESAINVCLSKMIDIGFAKGKLSLIDFPLELSGVCLHPNNILYCLNKLLAEYRAYVVENANLNSGREIISAQALGVSEVLRGLALETGTQLKYQSRLERQLCDCLFKKGFTVSELLIYGEQERLSVCLITCLNEIPVQKIEKIISDTLNCDMILNERVDILQDKCFLSFKKSAVYDAVYGLASAKKDGSDASGDTHAVTRVEGERLLIALSDGMGSGKNAQNVSSTALSLIESFYKAGLSSELILSTVNKLLSINTEDTFTALDVCVMDLNACTADFIKYGCPYGFIIGEQGIRIVEGSSLPLGIIDELKPAVCSATLNDGDVVLLLSDGVSDAFGSSGEIIDFLRSVPAKNPQTLANQILSTAIIKNGRQKKDDMTALAVRIFKRINK